MKIHQLLEASERPPRYIKTYFLGYKGTPIRPEHKHIISANVKKVKNPTSAYDRYVNEYSDEWYRRTNLGPGIHCFDDLLNIIRQYYEIRQR